MTAAQPLVDDEYTDAFGQRRQIAPRVRDAVRAAMGVAAGEPDPDDAPPIVARRGGRLPVTGELVLEDGTSCGEVGAVPPDAPYGYHRLLHRGGDALVIVGPGRCHLPRRLREWGWAIQLAATRSRASWGIGDLGDMADFGHWSAGQGAGFIAVSPLGAPNPGPQPEPSPYYPSTRRFLNPLHLAIERVPGAEAVGIDDLATAARALNAQRHIDRARVAALKTAALERIWRSGTVDHRALAAFRASRGAALDRWGTFAALSERHGPGWQSWPEQLRRPASGAVARFARAERDRVDFHAWVQSVLDAQLGAAAASLRRIADMPVGVDPGGFDAWDWQEQLAIGASVGAPPDRFNASGQDWGLPPFIPYRLREAGYRPFIDTIRAQLRHAGGLRVDHVLGLFRLWWIPAGFDPVDGAYVRYPTRELLEIVAIESHRARAVVIGEDLGTVPPGVRDELARRRVLSTRLVLFEESAPDAYPRGAFAAITTHDLPTVAGAWGGADLDDQARAGLTPDAGGLEQLRGRLAAAAGMRRNAALDRLVIELHRLLAASPSVLVAAALEDALRVEERPNLPGTTASQRANWSTALPVPLEQLYADRRVLELVAVLRR